MSFDLKAAREICNSIKGQNPEDGNCITHAFYKAAWDLLPAALDEIERLEAAYLKAQNSNLVRKRLCEQKDEYISEQAKRIAELESENETLREWGISNASDAAREKVRTEKQLAALKKLGQAKRARGKALVEERVRYNLLFPEMWSEKDRKDAKQVAREQLRREGKI